ncbi:MAG: glycoside hydrolase family 88 protein, partial [Clostridium sp.]|nr:glycoside hydrolase family 88 protein [Clostridium sp.]
KAKQSKAKQSKAKQSKAKQSKAKHNTSRLSNKAAQKRGKMLKLNYDQNVIEDAIDRIVKKTMNMDMTWDWPCGVAYYGISRAYEATGKKEYLDMLKERVDEYMELGLPKNWTVNTCAMGHCLITLYEETGDQKYWDVVMSKINYIRTEALRFGDNVLQHTVSANNDFPEQAWADTLFMAAYFLLRVGVKLKDADIIDDALNQYYWHIHYLQNPENGLYYHGYNNITGDHMSGFYWGRANAWAAYTMSRVGGILPEAYLYPKFLEITGSLNEQLAALKMLQTENGLWRTILDDEESYEEISASAGIAAAMVEKGNPLHSKYINKSIQGLLANIGADGKVMNVSGGTAVMKDRDGYRDISKRWIQGWGQGLALAFFSGVLQAGDEDKDGAL